MVSILDLYPNSILPNMDIGINIGTVHAFTFV